MSEDQSIKRSWRKVLYEKQAYPDNYIDPEKFLDQLCMEPLEKQGLSYFNLVLDTTPIALQFTVVVVFLTIYKLVLVSSLTIFDLFALDWSSIVICYMLRRNFDSGWVSLDPIDTLRKIFISGVCLRVSAPIMQTLTSSFSDDTIHALALTGASFHLVSFDYQMSADDSTTGSISGAISLNAAVFTAVLLASRLKNIETVVAFILFAAICFAILPGCLRVLQLRSLVYHVLFTLILWGIATVLLLRLDFTLFAVYEVCILFLWLVCPFGLKSMARYKRSLRGPWEEAVVTSYVSSNIVQ